MRMARNLQLLRCYGVLRIYRILLLYVYIPVHVCICKLVPGFIIFLWLFVLLNLRSCFELPVGRDWEFVHV